VCMRHDTAIFQFRSNRNCLISLERSSHSKQQHDTAGPCCAATLCAKGRIAAKAINRNISIPHLLCLIAPSFYTARR
jgi:hypothetical protein